MTIKVGDTLPDATVREFIEVEGNGCSVGPNTFQVADLARGKPTPTPRPTVQPQHFKAAGRLRFAF